MNFMNSTAIDFANGKARSKKPFDSVENQLVCSIVYALILLTKKKLFIYAKALIKKKSQISPFLVRRFENQIEIVLKAAAL